MRILFPTSLFLFFVGIVGKIQTITEEYYILILPVITLILIEILPVIKEFFSLLNLETTDLPIDNFELEFNDFMIFCVFTLCDLIVIQICTAESGSFKILS